MDEAHETLSGPATQKILYREYHEYGGSKYERLARISMAHIYNLRKSGTYRKRRVAYQATRPTKVSIGERRKPDPQGRPGYLRVDTVHQGDLDGIKGVYHINAVDEVTQWQVVGAAAQISEAWLLPVLEGLMEQFPFRIRGFHSDNGSEFINHTVGKLLNKLLAEQTKSRPRRCNDNGLAECKNGAVVRKHMGYGHIEARQLDPQRRDSLIYRHETLLTQAYVLQRPPCTVSENEFSYHNSCIFEICYVQEVCENRLKGMSRCTCGSPNALPTRLPMAFFVLEIAYPRSEGSVKNRA